MKVAIVAAVKNENLYINEWCHYYLDMGFDHIFLYDNNALTEPQSIDAIDEDIRQYITVSKEFVGIEYRGVQLIMYDKAYEAYGKDYDWMAFFDIDEFLDGISNIKEFLARPELNKASQIRFLWKLFGDENVIERDLSIPVHKFFKTPSKVSPFLEGQAKCMLRTGIPNLKFRDTHFAMIQTGDKTFEEIPSCIPSGKPVTSTAFKIWADYSEETVYLNHYRTKTLAEYLSNKMQRGDMICNYVKLHTLDYFWAQNEKTPEKIAYIKKNYPQYDPDIYIHYKKEPC